VTDYGTGGLDTFQTGTAGARTIATAGSAIVNTQNTLIRGDYAGGTFTTNLVGGADVLVITAAGAGYNAVASLGTNALVLSGYGANIATITATQFV